MIDIRKIKTNDSNYPLVEELLVESFPLEERRDKDIQRGYTDHKEAFHCNIILDKEEFIGLITYWNLDTFHYIEHFAIAPQWRNKGYGQLTLERIKDIIPSPILLEVEEPTNEISNRRIQFYQRQGFSLHHIPYLQPPYREGGPWIPLKLMSYGKIDIQQLYPSIKEKIYKEVYNQ